jgi:hypothetical protein
MSKGDLSVFMHVVYLLGASTIKHLELVCAKQLCRVSYPVFMPKPGTHRMHDP